MLKNWNWKHYLVWAAFLLGFAGAALAAISNIPAGTPTITIVLTVGSFAAIFASKLASFRMNPPQDPTQAFQQGEESLTSAKAGARGFVALRTLVAVSMMGTALFLMFGATQGCDWWAKNQTPVVQDINKDGQCVLGAILGGAASPEAVVAQCADLSVAQVLSIASSLFDYYVIGRTDAGFAGAALPPYHGIPSSLDGSDMRKLTAFVGD